jgi:2-polyprenyl-3-methyl-5-hydroxy-6-metoxy-1,4-benzoquinol methylase
LDLAQAALDKIQPKRGGHKFVCGSVEDFKPAEQWDAIVFNEVLYYTLDPVAQLKKFERALRPDGLMIISIFRKSVLFSPNNRCSRRVQSYIDTSGYTVLDAVRVSKIRDRKTWEIFVVRPPQNK